DVCSSDGRTKREQYHHENCEQQMVHKRAALTQRQAQIVAQHGAENGQHGCSCTTCGLTSGSDNSSCVLKITMPPCRTSAAIRRHNSARASTSRAAAGSSSSHTCLCSSHKRASATRRRCPADNLPQRRRCRLRRPSCVSASPTCAASVRQPLKCSSRSR